MRTLRTTTTTTIALGLLLLVGPALGASIADDVEITDPVGDAGPAASELGPATASMDIRQVDLASDANGTTATMELAAFDVRPHETFYGIAYELNGSSFVWFGYGKILLPFPPFEHEGFYGCHLTEDGEACHELDGSILDGTPGFRVQIPRAWAPANATLKDPMAASFHDPFLPHPAGQVWWQAVWPHNTEDMAGPGESFHVPGANASSGAGGGTQLDPASASAPGSEVKVAGLGTGMLGALAAGSLAALGGVGVAIRRGR